jgi:hypothetical protein
MEAGLPPRFKFAKVGEETGSMFCGRVRVIAPVWGRPNVPLANT